MKSTMQSGQLGLPLLMRHVHHVNGRSKLLSVTTSGGYQEMTFSHFSLRAGQLGKALEGRGIRPGTVVATLMASSQEHLEAYLGVPASGRILHTINVRLHDEQIIYIADSAQAEVFFVDSQNLKKFMSIAPHLKNLKLLVVVGDAIGGGGLKKSYDEIDYETLLTEADPQIDWPEIDENNPAILCFTGGTTGVPKGVAYSHRSIWLQAMSLCTTNSVGLGSASKLLPAVPLYHVNGWGLPFAALMAGADLMLPGQFLQAKALLALIDEKSPNIAAGVPTIWSDILELLRSSKRTNLGVLKTIFCGGALVPKYLSDAYEEMGVRMVQAWGMTETSSMSAIAQMPEWAVSTEEKRYYASAQGRIVCGLEARIVDLEGNILPSDGISSGEVQIRGPWVTESYLNSEDRKHLHDNWLKTGDLGSIDKDGFIFLSDRVKDAIKSGGEWIPSLMLEEAIRSHPSVQDVAVIPLDDPRWQERPGAVVVLENGSNATIDELTAWLQERVAKWWIPDSWSFIEELPRTAVGKMDKKQLRQAAQDILVWQKRVVIST